MSKVSAAVIRYVTAGPEEWREIPGWPYQVSSRGRIMRATNGPGTHAGRILRDSATGSGYRVVKLHDGNGGARSMSVHRLVAFAFLGPPPTAMHTVNHRNGDKSDNRISNLEWLTPHQNTMHAKEMGTLPMGTSHGNAKLTEEAVMEMRLRHQLGESMRGLAGEFGVSCAAARAAITGAGWAHVPMEHQP